MASRVPQPVARLQPFHPPARLASSRSLRRWLAPAWLGAGLAIAVAVPPRATADLERERQQFVHRLQSADESRRVDAVNDWVASRQPQKLPLLLDTLHDPSPAVRAAVAANLFQYPDPRVVPALRGLLQDENDRVRAGAVWSLSLTRAPGVIGDVIERARKDPSWSVRFRAVSGLAQLRDPSALPVAVAALGDENVSVRERAALIALDALADASVVERLLELRSHPQPGTRRLVMYLLGRYGQAAVAPALMQGLKDPDPLVRGEAALALGKLRIRTASEALGSLLQDPEDHVRGAAAFALGGLGEPSAMPQLRPLLHDEAAFVRAVAAESLQRLGDPEARPPTGFHAAEVFTFPLHESKRLER